jgi:VanZ family protein
MRTLRFSHLVQFAAWALIAVIAYATLTHVGLVYSIYFKLAPFLMYMKMSEYAAAEHLAAFALLGALFSVAYPKRVVMVYCLVFGSAIALELMQTLTPDRHGTVLDAIQKIAGGAFGIFAAKAVLNFWAQK